MERYMVRSATRSFLGEAQIHRDGFRDTFDVEKTINDLDAVTARLDEEPGVAHYAVRTMAFAMVSSPANMSGVSMVGVQPDKERYLSQMDDVIAEGTYFAGDGERDVVIGSKLADVLEVGIGDRVVLTTTQAHTGDLSQELFRVSGIYHFNINDLDQGFAFVRIDKARRMLALDGQAHEIAVSFHSPEAPLDNALPFWSDYSTNGNEALSWTRLMPQLDTVFKMSEFNLLISGLLLFGIVAFGIMNTLFMSLHERMFEFGVMRAVGTRGWDMLRMVLFEAASLSVVGMVMGAAIGAVATVWVGHVGINYSGVEFAGVTLRDRIYPVFHAMQYIKYPAWLFVLTTLVGLYPAATAARLTPARAMRKSF
jgi:ABC-type lipoprotein release transport system permease subunit